MRNPALPARLLAVAVTCAFSSPAFAGTLEISSGNISANAALPIGGGASVNVGPGATSIAPTPGGVPSLRTGSAANLATETGSASSINNGPDQKWGDPLSADLLGSSNVKVRARYYSDVAGTGNQEGVGLSLSLSTN